jgi:DNA-binding NarL/FixJ family response regulator
MPEPTPVPQAPALPIDRTASELRAAVQDLAAEGLSDRSIARRLRIALEEVRLARASGGGSRRLA